MTDSILFWNQVALDASKADFSSPTPADDPAPQQPGPTYSSRALAIVHLAMYDAYAAITGSATYLTYGTVPGISTLPAAQAAVAAAACLTLVAMFSRQKDFFLKKHGDFLAALGATDPEVEKGLAWGKLVANQMLDSRKNDGSEASNDQYAPSAMPYRHRPDPLNPAQGFLGPLWGKVTPFGVNNLNSVITALPAPPASAALYATNFNQVKTLGQEQGSTRTPAQTTTGLFWAYDGARNIGLPPRLYNQVIRAIAMTFGSTEAQNAKLFAMVNAGMADAGIQAWYEKYKHNFWRPVVGIRESDAGWGPTGIGDSNATTIGDSYWKPLGAPRTNRTGAPSFTPGFPAYPSGHATFGTTALRLAERALALPAAFTFNFVSDEFNGENAGAAGIRPVHKRTMTIAQAIEDNLASRVFLGVHWRFDGDTGRQIGEDIAMRIATAFPAKA